MACNVFSAVLDDDRTFFTANRAVLQKEDGRRVFSFVCRIVTSHNTLKAVSISTDYGTEKPFRRIVTIADTNQTFGNITDALCKRLFNNISRNFLDNGDLQFLFFAVENVKRGSAAHVQLERLGFKPYQYNENPGEYSVKFVDEEAPAPAQHLINLGAHKKDPRLVA